MLVYTGRLRDKSRERGRRYMMLRKIMIAAAAVSFLGAMAASTTADAQRGHMGGFSGFRGGAAMHGGNFRGAGIGATEATPRRCGSISRIPFSMSPLPQSIA